jgi:4'-phosphopantetheinyl transferase
MNIAWPQPPDTINVAPDRLDVWAVPLDGRLAAIGNQSAILSAAELERADQFRLEEPRRRFILTRCALRELLGRYCGMPASDVAIEIDRQGKPRIGRQCGAEDVRFNVAHSSEMALIAVTMGCEVGVDVERLRPVRHLEHIAQRYFHPAESTALLAARPAEREAAFLRCWTAKEAVLKALGHGITGSLAGIQVPIHQFASTWIDLPAELSPQHSRCWLHRLAPCDGYLAAVASLGAKRDVCCYEFDL